MAVGDVVVTGVKKEADKFQWEFVREIDEVLAVRQDNHFSTVTPLHRLTPRSMT